MTTILQIFHYATLPGAAALFCILIFMTSGRSRGKLLLLSLSAAISLNVLLKALFRVPRPWLMHAESAPFLAEGGFAFPCLHTQLTAAVLCSFVLTSRKNRRWMLPCAAWITATAALRVTSGVQSLPDVLAGLAAGVLCAYLIWPFSHKHTKACYALILLTGLIAAIGFDESRGLGLCLTVLILEALEPVFGKADSGRTPFGMAYGTVLAAGIYTGLYIFLPFLVEWLITPLWPGQTLITFLITLLPCLLRIFPVF